MVPKVKFVGAHISAQGGVSQAPENAWKIGARAFALFTKNQRRWFSEPYREEEVRAFKKNLEKRNFLPGNILAHASYLINLANPDSDKRKLSINSLIDECRRCELLGIENLVVHPGSHLKKISEREGLDYIADSLNQVITATNEIRILLENTAGQGGNLGHRFEQLHHIISRISSQERVGVCLDTCHLFAAGYDFLNGEKYEALFTSFDEIVGMKYLGGMHLNDSKGNLGSFVDRHESLGKGKIGWEPFRFIMKDHRLDNIPLILETVNPDLWKEEIAILYDFQ